MKPGSAAVNDAQLIQDVKSSLGRNRQYRDEGRINVSSCKSVITLHGYVGNEEASSGIESLVRGVRGVQGVENRLRVRT